MTQTHQGYSVLAIQRALNANGFRLEEDGIMGPRTEAALSAFKRRRGWRARPWVGPLTAAALGITPVAEGAKPREGIVPPWLSIMAMYMYKHEVANNAQLKKFLKADGRTLGDPAKLPWCGDWMETCIRLTLPDEPFPGALGENPYWARNWVKLGYRSKLAYGAIVVLRRGNGGHVACAVGHDPDQKRIRLRGGNQSNRVIDTWAEEKRVLDIRKPKTWPHRLSPCPVMNSRGAVVSENEV